ncbi:hypothetical protein [Helicobacter suis]|uniref:hypothetical protein n=1 Tax=Helicobacter suis TaxID=104628 RepID=UPI0013D4AC91|nr:hypothetical protein [Helicobacter suis]
MIDPSQSNTIEVEVLENIPTDYRALVEAAYALGLKNGQNEAAKATQAAKNSNKPKSAPKFKPIYNPNDFYKEFGTDKPMRD